MLFTKLSCLFDNACQYSFSTKFFGNEFHYGVWVMGDEIIFPFISLSLSALYLTLKSERFFSIHFLCAIHGFVVFLPIHSSSVFCLINIRTFIIMGKGNEKTQSMHCSVLSLEKKLEFSGEQYNKKPHSWL